MIITKKNIPVSGPHGPMLVDVFYEADGVRKPIVVFAHGFKGFKDWGHFNLVAKAFAKAGFVFVKFNFSHNGTTVDQPTDFADLEAFGKNNFSIELDDLGAVIDYVLGADFEAKEEIDSQKLYLLGHSRGGGIVLLKAHEDDRVKKVATWASVNEYGKHWSQDVMGHWKEEGVMYIENSRTKQSMPLYYQLYEDYFDNLDRLHIPSAVKALDIPLFFTHGTEDPTVPCAAALKLKEWSKKGKLLEVDGGDHVFGARHPYMEDELPKDAQLVVKETVKFFTA